MKINEYKNWLKLVSINGVGPGKLKKLLRQYGNPLNIFKADNKSLSSLNYLTPKNIKNILSVRENEFVSTQLKLLDKYNVRLISIQDEEYPDLLKFIYTPPILLYIKGEILPEDSFSFAIVGTRKATNYGKIQTNKIGFELAKSGFSIVSGLAYGIDSVAHTSALKAGGRTIAVCGTGLDVVYPPTNRKLAENIIRSGALISEFPLESKIEPWNFPTRNRIISGMSRGVLVVEGSKKSGALITSKDGLQQDRDIFALPGNVDSPQSEGPNYLIKLGAKLVTCAKDILEEYEQLTLFSVQVRGSKNNTIPKSSYKMTDDEGKIYDIIQKNGRNITLDSMVESSSFTVSQLSAMLLNMEIKGIVKRAPQNHYLLV